ncbi:MAG: hypothetical protein IPM24_09720 [Bryobacterales bacterium]|nr:hypothetical protein [Bryobacterales bacterium]
MGDDIFNYPFGSGSGTVNVHGWISVEFSEPVGRTSRFRMRWHAVGDVPFFAFASGHFLHVTGEQTFHSAIQVSQGNLNLDTGEVTNLDVHAIFQNVLIQKSARYDRLPVISDGTAFSALFLDFPPPPLPIELPFSERPVTSQTARFILDANQRITGFEFHGVTFIPINALPALGLMPPFTFAREGVTIVPGMEGCLPGTVPESQCLSESRFPDGIASPENAYLSPNLRLVTAELREVARSPVSPPALPEGPVMGAAAAALAGRLYLTGGSDGSRPVPRLSSYDPSANEWTNLPDLPRGRWQHCAAAAGGRLYVAGGREGGPDPVNSVVAYDPATRSWSPVAPLPVAATQGACAALDSRIYWFGGATGSSGLSDAALVFDPSAGQWSPLPPLPVPLAGSAVAVAGREIWVINGTMDGRTATNRVFVFTPDSGLWREGPATTRAVFGGSASWLDGRIYLAGGRTAPEGALDVGTELYHSQTTQLFAAGQWYDGLSPLLPAAGMAGAALGDTWYLAGGDTASTSPPSPTGIVQAFRTPRGWVASDTYPVFTTQTVRNAAGLGVGPEELAPGALASILGSNFTSRTLVAPPVREEGRFLTTDLPQELGGVRVTLDGAPAGIVSVSPARIDFQVPFGVSAGRALMVRVSRDGAEAPAAFVRVAPAAPGIFTYTYGEARAVHVLNEAAAIATNADGTLNYPSQPAHPGELITLRVTGLGAVDRQPEPLQRAPRDPAMAVQLPEVLIDGRLAAVQAAILVPGEAGLYDVRVTIPRETRTGERVLVQLRTGDIESNKAVLAIE